jgi:chromosome partitioning protein
VIDVGAKDSGAMRAALSLCDVMVFPFAPRSFDVWAFENTVNLAREMQAINEFKVLAFLNKADPAAQGADNKASIEYVAQYGLPIAAASLGDRKAFAHASAAGRHITEFRDAPPAARLEMEALLEEIISASK